MRKLFTIIAVVIFTSSVFAQAPQKMSYQCVIRNTGGVLVINQSVGVKISILQGSPLGPVTYAETYSPNPQTNDNGLLTVEIGGGIPVTGTFSAINWATGPYFLKTETDPTGGTTYTVVGISQLLSVPYALYSKSAENGFSGDYNDLTNRPTLFNGTWAGLTGKPTTIGGYGITDAFNGTWASLTGKPTTIGGYGITDAFNGTWASLTGKPTFAPVATTGSYTDLTNRPASAGVDYVESGGGTIVSLNASSSNLNSVTITAPGPGYITVHASGSFYHSIAATSGLMIRYKVSNTNNDVSETPGIQFIRMYGFPVSSGTNSYPFSVSKVFNVSAAGNYTFYLNAWHQIENGTVYIDDYTLIGSFVPYLY